MNGRLPAAVRGLPARVRAAAAIEKLAEHERDVLALLLVERLTPLEAAGALRMTVRQVETIFSAAVDEIAAEAGLRRAQRRSVA